MNALDQYLKRLDAADYDHRDAQTINSEFQKVLTQLLENGDEETSQVADLDRQAFAVQKSFDIKLDHDKGTINGLSWQISGKQTLENGLEAPLYWPNVARYSKKEFQYFEKRYKETKNLYAKTEYGLVVYFGGHTEFANHNAFKKQLFADLFALAKKYYGKANAGGVKNYYGLDFFRTIRLAFRVAEKAKVEPELSNVVNFIYEIHQNWDITKEGTLRILFDLSELMSEFFSLFVKHIDFQKILSKNIEGATALEKTHTWGAMYAVDRNIAIEQKRNGSSAALFTYKARLYEKLASEALGQSNLASVNFVEHALRIYQQLKDSANTKRLETLYAELRGKFQLSEIRQELPQEHIDDLNKRILKAVTENDEAGLINLFILSPWYDKIANIKERAIELSEQSVFMSMLPTSIVDKFGNTVEVFHTDEEKEQFNFWNSYTFNFQIGTQTMHMFFVEAFKSGKLNYDATLKYLESTWFNDIINRSYHGQEVHVRPIDTLKPGLRRLFLELDLLMKNNKYECDLVTITDSLALKIEGLLRYFCEKINIATFKTRKKGNDKLVMEKLIDDLLADIKHKPPLKPDQETNFDEEDRILIKYVMSEKAGVNLRNSIAHGLIDIFEYSFEYIVVLYCIILKLSKYKFIETPQKQAP